MFFLLLLAFCFVFHFISFWFWRCRNKETLIHLLKIALGTGIFAMPNAFKSSGFVVGIVGTIIVGFITNYCVHSLVHTHYMLCKRNKVAVKNWNWKYKLLPFKVDFFCLILFVIALRDFGFFSRIGAIADVSANRWSCAVSWTTMLSSVRWIHDVSIQVFAVEI